MTHVILKVQIYWNAGCFDAERQVDLPIEPFVGMNVRNAYYCSLDVTDEIIEEIAVDLKTGSIICYLEDNDFTSNDANDINEAHYTENDIRSFYRDWTLEKN